MATLNADAPAVEVRGFSFAYPGEKPCVGPVDWRVDAGAFQLLSGATGSGKTTLLRCLNPALAPVGSRTGEVALFGCSVEQMEMGAAAWTVGYVAQSPENQLVCDTVWHELAFGLENLGVPHNEMRRRVAEVAHFFGIEPWFRRPVADLSGGQKQMVTLASVLVMQPRLLLLDEPTAQLDPVAEKNFLHALFRVNRELGITVVLATHTPEAVAAYATDFVELQDGRLMRRTPQIPPRPAQRVQASSHHPKRTCAEETLMVRDAYVRYSREDDWVLRGCDLAVRRGAIHALVGGNGCGKTTLLRLVAGMVKPERGRARNNLAACQAYLPQDPKALFVCDTVNEELREWQPSCGYTDAEVSAVLKRFNLAERAHNHPYDLSGGQQQSLAFAKLLLTKPGLLLLDEPTKGLDASSKVTVAEAITAAAREGTTVVMATHDLTFAALVADEVTMLFDGEAACSEPADEFFANNLFYRPQPDAFSQRWLEGER